MSLFANDLIKEPLYSSDLSETAVEDVKKNAKQKSCKIIAKKSNLFSEWKDEKFEMIVCTVSQISEEVAPISPWFDVTDCATGKGGAMRMVSTTL